MKKIYSKFTRERAPQFQIETSIYSEGGKKFAAKRPLTDAAAAHVAALHENYHYFKKNQMTLFAECELFGDGVCFPFVEGVTYYTQLLEAAEAGDRERFDKLLEIYRRIVEESCRAEADGEDDAVTEFAETPEFAAVFGSYPELAGKKSCVKLDIDLTFDNVILTPEGDNRIIDYEWMFDFPVPVEFVFYRAVLALYVRNGAGLNSFLSQAELFRYFGIGEKEQEIYGLMNEAFNDYTSGGENAFAKAQKKYAKKAYVLSQWVKQSSGVVELYLSKDASFRTAKCMDFQVGENVDIHVELKDYMDTRVIRLDPLNVPGTIHHFKMTYTQQGEEKVLDRIGLRHNAMMVYNDSYVFTGEDPQMIWDIPDDLQPESIHVSYSIGEAKDGMTLLKTQVEELKEKEKKLAYIQGTKAYKMFLEKKVDGIFGGEH